MAERSAASRHPRARTATTAAVGQPKVTKTNRAALRSSAQDHFRRSFTTSVPQPRVQAAVMQQQQSAAAAEFSAASTTRSTQALRRERAALEGRARALSPRGQLALLNNLFWSLDSSAEKMDRIPTTTRQQPGHLVSKQALHRRRSETQRLAPVDYQPRPLRRHRSEPADDLPKKPATPISIVVAPENPVRRRYSAPLQHLSDVQLPPIKTWPVAHPVADSAGLDRKETAGIQVASARLRGSTSDHSTAAHRHPRRHSHTATSESNLNARLAGWCHEERDSVGVLTPVAGFTKTSPPKAVASVSTPRRNSWWHACWQALMAFFTSLWASLALVFALLPGRTRRYACKRQPKMDQLELVCEFKAAEKDLYECKEEFLRCKSALVRAEKRFARAATPQLAFSSVPSILPSAASSSVSTAAAEEPT